jgi:hypothetical protein
MMGILITDPRNMPFSLWAPTVMADLPQVPQQPAGEERWKEWAKAIFESTNLCPDPMPFNGWQDWALAWIRTS